MSLRGLPQVDELIRATGIDRALGHALAVSLAREAIAAARARALDGEEPEPGAVEEVLRARAAALETALIGPVVNATGVILHTNLGRAPLSENASRAVADAVEVVNVEFDVTAGERGARAPASARLACALTGAEAAHVVNNNAGALVLALAALAKGREVIVSRGELIEIGGEFRLPAIMEASGAVLKEVGTTNRTRVSDIRSAINAQTGLVLKVHPSNYRIVGFTQEPSLTEVCNTARDAGLPVLYDIGSGLLEPEPLLPGEPDARSALEHGADLVCFSGDKLLGGPQAGIIAGRKDLIDTCKRHPLARALRADKMTLAALEHTLLAYSSGARDTLPVWRMIGMSAEDIGARAEKLAANIEGAITRSGSSVVGGGSLPGHSLPTVLLVLPGYAPRTLERLRAGSPPVVARIEDDACVLDLRTVPPEMDDELAALLKRALA